MSKRNTGGPAFPVPATQGEHDAMPEEGMTLRDYFAAKALPQILANPAFFIDNPGIYSDYAESAYAIADAMLGARK